MTFSISYSPILISETIARPDPRLENLPDLVLSGVEGSVGGVEDLLLLVRPVDAAVLLHPSAVERRGEHGAQAVDGSILLDQSIGRLPALTSHERPWAARGFDGSSLQSSPRIPRPRLRRFVTCIHRPVLGQ
jgi:hypothetical protein